jgi:BRCA1-associated protein
MPSFDNETRHVGPAAATFVPHIRTKSGSTNLPEGTVHLFRDSANTPHNEELDTEASLASMRSNSDGGGVMLGILAVPPWMTPSDFLAFVAPAVEGMAHLRIIRRVAITCLYACV